MNHSITLIPPSITTTESALPAVMPVINRTTAEKAAAVAMEFLLDHLGNQLIAGQPLSMVSALHTLWVVPIHLAYTHTGIVGNVGVVAIDDETAHVIAWTPIAQIKAASRALRESLEPQLSQQFQKSLPTNQPADTEPVHA